jgi:hypothetical protein
MAKTERRRHRRTGNSGERRPTPQQGRPRSRRTLAARSRPDQPSEPLADKAAAIRGPLPEGAAPEDYVGGEKPHKTRDKETKTGTPAAASGKRNEVV